MKETPRIPSFPGGVRPLTGHPQDRLLGWWGLFENWRGVRWGASPGVVAGVSPGTGLNLSDPFVLSAYFSPHFFYLLSPKPTYLGGLWWLREKA